MTEEKEIIWLNIDRIKARGNGCKGAKGFDNSIIYSILFYILVIL